MQDSERDRLTVEVCARAMVQPDIAEVERLLQVYEYECEDSARAALLDYVRQGFAAAQRPVSEAEVSMPDAIGRLYFGGVSCGERDEWEFDADQGVCDGINESATAESRQRAYLHRDVRAYGDAREAAGYARGLEVRLSPEKMRIAAAGWREFDFVEGLAGEAAMIDRICSAIYAALRGEVKP